jgi:addiction module HigA family antidote
LAGRVKLLNVHPGDVLREDFLVPLGMTPYRLAKSIGMDQTAVGEILSSKRSVTANTALRLSRFFGTTAQFWLNLQTSYDLEEERERRAEELEKIKPYEAVVVS